MTQFFGYWGGSLPPVTNLHFKSFIHFHANSHYDLWLDDDVGCNIPSDLLWIKHHPQIRVREFSLSKLVDQYVSPITKGADSSIYDLLRFIHRKKILRYINLKSYYDPLFKINYKHSSPLFTYQKDLVYRGDLARCIIPVAHYNASSLYSDLDVCFLSDLNDICLDQGFVYQWESYDFANSAILYSPNQEVAKRILEAGNSIECFRPWYLFANAVCKKLNLKIYPNNQFDAMWDSESMLSGDAMKFFVKSPYSLQMVNELFEKNYIVNHWHNNWRTIPEEGSPYDLLQKKYNSKYR
jgi:hypothetical protein